MYFFMPNDFKEAYAENWDDVRRILRKLENSEYRAAGLDNKGNGVYTLRINDKHRLFIAFYEQNVYLIHLMLDHKYYRQLPNATIKAKSILQGRVENYIQIDELGAWEEEKQTEPLQLQPCYPFRRDFICLDSRQTEALDYLLNSSAVVVGAPGSGKTIVATIAAEKNADSIVISPYAHVVNAIQEETGKPECYTTHQWLRTCLGLAENIFLVTNQDFFNTRYSDVYESEFNVFPKNTKAGKKKKSGRQMPNILYNACKFPLDENSNPIKKPEYLRDAVYYAICLYAAFSSLENSPIPPYAFPFFQENQDIRSQLLAIAQCYKEDLKRNKKVDPAVSDLDFLNDVFFPRMIIDEGQGMPLNLLKYLLNLSDTCVLFMDPNQSLIKNTPPLSLFYQLFQSIKEKSALIELNSNFRNSASVSRLAEKIFHLKHRYQGISPKSLPLGDQENMGRVGWIEVRNQETRENDLVELKTHLSRYQTSEVVIVIPEVVNRHEISSSFEDKYFVLYPHEVIGLEFFCVVAWNPVYDDMTFLKKISEKLESNKDKQYTEATIANPLASNRNADVSANHFFQRLYMVITRAITECIFVQFDFKHGASYLIDQIKCAIESVAAESSLEKISTDEKPSEEKSSEQGFYQRFCHLLDRENPDVDYIKEMVKRHLYQNQPVESRWSLFVQSLGPVLGEKVMGLDNPPLSVSHTIATNSNKKNNVSMPLRHKVLDVLKEKLSEEDQKEIQKYSATDVRKLWAVIKEFNIHQLSSDNVSILFKHFSYIHLHTLYPYPQVEENNISEFFSGLSLLCALDNLPWNKKDRHAFDIERAARYLLQFLGVFNRNIMTSLRKNEGKIAIFLNLCINTLLPIFAELPIFGDVLLGVGSYSNAVDWANSLLSFLDKLTTREKLDSFLKTISSCQIPPRFRERDSLLFPSEQEFNHYRSEILRFILLIFSYIEDISSLQIDRFLEYCFRKDVIDSKDFYLWEGFFGRLGALHIKVNKEQLDLVTQECISLEYLDNFIKNLVSKNANVEDIKVNFVNIVKFSFIERFISDHDPVDIFRLLEAFSSNDLIDDLSSDLSYLMEVKNIIEEVKNIFLDKDERYCIRYIISIIYLTKRSDLEQMKTCLNIVCGLNSADLRYQGLIFLGHAQTNFKFAELSVQCLSFLVDESPFSHSVFLRALLSDDGAWILYIALCIQSFKDRGEAITADHSDLILNHPFTYSLFISQSFVSEAEQVKRFMAEPSYFSLLLKTVSSQFTAYSCERAVRVLYSILCYDNSGNFSPGGIDAFRDFYHVLQKDSSFRNICVKFFELAKGASLHRYSFPAFIIALLSLARMAVDQDTIVVDFFSPFAPNPQESSVVTGFITSLSTILQVDNMTEREKLLGEMKAKLKETESTAENSAKDLQRSLKRSFFVFLPQNRRFTPGLYSPSADADNQLSIPLNRR